METMDGNERNSEQMDEIRDPFASDQAETFGDPFTSEQAENAGDPFASEAAEDVRDPFAPEAAEDVRDPFASEPTEDVRDPFADEEEEKKDTPAEPEKKVKKGFLKTVWGRIALIAVFVAALAGVLVFTNLKKRDQAIELLQNGEYREAVTLCSRMHFVSDANQLMEIAGCMVRAEEGYGEEAVGSLLDAGVTVLLNYDLDGGEFISSGRQKNVVLNSRDDFATFYKAKKDFHEFDGWDLSDVRYAPTESLPKAEMDLKAKYSLQVYTISYTNLLDGETNNPKEYTVESDTITIEAPTRKGYTFNYWEGTGLKGNEKVIVIGQGESGDRIYIANWIPNQYVMTFQPGNGVRAEKEGDRIPAQQKVRFDDNYKLPAVAKDGYRYCGWTDGKDTYKEGVWKKDSDLTLNPKWELENYKITYKDNGGTLPSGMPGSYTVETDTFSIGSPTRKGYQFVGWTDGTEAEPNKGYQVPKGSFGNLVLSAEWQGNPHTVTLDPSGGSLSDTKVEVVFGSKYSLPKPYKTGNAFTGWFNGNSNVPSNGTWEIDSDMKLTAGWKPAQYTITLDAAGGACSAGSMTVTYGSSYTLPTPTRNGYTFKGWYSGDNRVESGTWMREENLALKAVWQGNTYTIRFNANGGELSSTSMNVVFGSNVTLPIPKKKGYKFTGWYSGYTKVNSGNWNITSNVDLKAEWEIGTYTIKFNPMGGKVSPTTQKFTYGKRYTLPTPTKAGYQFRYWVYEDEKVPQTGEWEIEADNKTFQAVWEGNPVTISLDPAGGTVSTTSMNLTVGSKYELPTPYRTGYSFTGWTSGSKKVATSGEWSLTDSRTYLTAGWERAKYTIKFEPAGGKVSPSSTSLGYGDTISLPTPTRTGYEFTGWYLDSQKVSAGPWNVEGNQTLTAGWEGLRYKVVLNPDGGNCSAASVEVVYGSNYSLPEAQKTGYVFKGWYSGSKMYSGGSWNETDNVNVTAKWEVASYVIHLDAGGGSVNPTSVKYRYGEAVNLPVPSRNGYDFVEWSGESFNPSSCTVDHDFTLSAVWRGKNFTITLVSEGTGSGSISVTCGEGYSLPEASKDGYEFQGWYSGSSKFPSSGTYDKPDNITLTAKFKKLPEKKQKEEEEEEEDEDFE